MSVNDGCEGSITDYPFDLISFQLQTLCPKSGSLHECSQKPIGPH